MPLSLSAPPLPVPSLSVPPLSVPPLTVPSLSILEKHLLRLGFSLRDECDARTNFVTTVAAAPGPDGASSRLPAGPPAASPADPAMGAELRYPKPTYLYHGRDRVADASSLLAAMAALLGRPESEIAALAMAGLSTAPEGFACVQCGRCCTRVRDAFQGRVSPEEVQEWADLGLSRILRLVDRVDRRGFSFYRAWIDPRTGRAHRCCPWLRRDGGGKAVCRIQAHKPLKCRAFPASAAHADYAGCPGMNRGMDGGAGPGPEPGSDQPSMPGAFTARPVVLRLGV